MKSLTSGRREWSRRLERMRAGTWRIVCAVGRGVSTEIGRDEVFLCLGLVLLGYGLWLTPWQPAAFIVPGAALLWMSLPPRRPFVVSPAPRDERRGS